MQTKRNAHFSRALASIFAGAALCLAPGLMTGDAAAEEVAPGTTIDASNIDTLLDHTYDGVRVGDALPERIRWMVRNWNLRMTLEANEAWPKDKVLEELTRQYSPQVKLDPSTKEISNYVTGVPFPEIDFENDKDAGWKVVWNFRYGKQQEDNAELPWFVFVLTDGTSGIEREQEWYLFSHHGIGNTRRDHPHVLGDGTLFNKSILAALAPHDVKGTGVLTIRYSTGKLDDTWAYIRTVRRVRRLSGGAWVDPIGGTDQLQDDFQGFNAHPTWYKDFKVVGRQKMFVQADIRKSVLNPEANSHAERYPGMDVTNPPYWNLTHPWQVRDVVIVEAIPPEIHPYSRKLLYFAPGPWTNMFGEFFDKKGEIWKTINLAHKCWCGDLGRAVDFGGFGLTTTPDRNIVYPINGVTVDYQRLHATTFVADRITYNSPNLEPDDISLSMLEEKAR